MTVRNLREWRTLGLLPPAEIRGRVGYYDESVVERIEGVKQLQAEGFPLDLIRRMLVIHRQPDGSTYRLIQLFSEDDTVSMEGRSESIHVSDILPARD